MRMPAHESKSAHTSTPRWRARLLRLPVGTRIVVTTHPLIDAAAIVPKAEDPHSEPPAGVRVVEVWQRELEYGARLTPPLFFVSPAGLCRAPVAVRDPPLEPAPLGLFGSADRVLSPPAPRRRGNAAGESRLDLVWISFASSPAISPRLHLVRISPVSRLHLARTTPHLARPLACIWQIWPLAR